VKLAHTLEMPGEPRGDAFGQRDHAVLPPLAVAHPNLPHGEVGVLHAQLERLVEPEPCPVQKTRDEEDRALEPAEDRANLFGSQHDRNPPRLARSHETFELPDVAAEDVAAQEHERVQRLVLRGRSHLAVDREVIEEGRDLAGAHLVGVTLAVEQDEPASPVDVRLFRARAVVAKPDCPAYAIEQPRARGSRARRRGGG